MKLHDRVCVLTGAGSGLGRTLAEALARRGCHLALADLNAKGLAETARLVQPRGVTLSCHALDVADRAAVRALPAAVLAAHGRVDVLINNAGVALGGTFEQVSEEDFDWLLDINFHGLVRLTRAFLPYLHRSDEARLVNISSLYGLIAPAGQTAYSASKFAVRGFSQALRHELEGTRVGVTLVHPGGVATSIARNARIAAGIPPEVLRQNLALQEKLLRLPPARAAEIIVRGIERGQARILVGADAWAVALLERLAPVSYWQVLKKLLGPRR